MLAKTGRIERGLLGMRGELNSVYLLGAFALGLVLACRCALQLALGAHRGRRWTAGVFLTAALTVTGILAADAIGDIDSDRGSLAPILSLPVCGLALISLPLHIAGWSLRLPARELITRPIAWLVLAWSVGASGWSAFRFYEAEAPVASDLASSPHPDLKIERQATAISDCGRPIPLFCMHAPVAGWPGGFQAATPALKRMTQTVIWRGSPDASSNCHGWVFAGGKYLLDGNGVQTVLDDNGYQRCDDPRPGDLIVYWSGKFVAHTGLVSGVLADGTVLIESKWNLQERFLHRPEDQPYSRDYSFYRTFRGSHQITIRDSREPAM